MAHRAKHLRRNWVPTRKAAATRRAKKEAQRPASAPQERQRRELPVVSFLRGAQR